MIGFNIVLVAYHENAGKVFGQFLSLDAYRMFVNHSAIRAG